MKPAFVSSSSCCLSSTDSVALRRKVGRLGGDEPGTSSIRWSTSRDGGRPGGSSSGNTSWKSDKTRRRAAAAAESVGDADGDDGDGDDGDGDDGDGDDEDERRRTEFTSPVERSRVACGHIKQAESICPALC